MTLIEKPVAGQPMRAGWGASVAERLNQLGPFGVPGMLMRDGPFGQGSAPLPRNQRDRRGAAAATESAGCFAIVAGPIEEPEEGEEVSPTIHFGNRYLQFGNLTLTCDDVEITDADYPTPEPGQDPEVVIAIKATTTAYQSEPTISIVTYDSISEMQEDQHKLDYVIIPLYLLGENFSVQCDFRKQPIAPVGEVM